MSHHIYNTKGIILNSRTQREADRAYTILTSDLGLVRATAQGVRKGSSKLGGILMKFSVIEISLVKGKNIWRITTAAMIDERVKFERKKLVSLARITSLIEKLVHGEEKSKMLFDTLKSAIEFLVSVSDEDRELWEVAVVSRILYNLGYLSEKEAGEEYLETQFNTDLLKETREKKRKLVTLINQGLKESGF